MVPAAQGRQEGKTGGKSIRQTDKMACSWLPANRCQLPANYRPFPGNHPWFPTNCRWFSPNAAHDHTQP